MKVCYSIVANAIQHPTRETDKQHVKYESADEIYSE